MDNMKREEKVALHVLSVANVLREEGLITGTFPHMTSSGARLLSSLHKDGFVPSVDEEVDAMSVMAEMYNVNNTQEGNFVAGGILDNMNQANN